MTPERPDDEASLRLANVLVIVALAAMLAGAVVLLSARDPVAEEIPPGATQVVLRHSVPSFSPFYDAMHVTLGARSAASLAGGNVSLYANETTRGIREARDSFTPGQVPDWQQPAAPGDQWTVTLVNHSNETISAVGATSSRLHHTAGGVLVGIGVLGFVFYRLGMRRT